MEAPFFSGLVVLNEWKVLENCWRVWKRSRSNEKTQVGRVLINMQCFITLERHRHRCRCSHEASESMGTRARLQGCWYHKVLLDAGHPQSLPACSAPAGFITRGFTETTEVLNEQPKNGGTMRSGRKGCLQNDHDPSLFQRGKISLPSLRCTLLPLYLSRVEDAKTHYPWEKPWEFNFNKSQFDLFSAAFLNQLVATPKGRERQLEDTTHLKSYYRLK